MLQLIHVLLSGLLKRMLASFCRRGIGESVANNRDSQVVVSSVQSWQLTLMHTRTPQDGKPLSTHLECQPHNSRPCNQHKKNITKQSTPTIEVRKLEDKLPPKKNLLFLGKLMPMTTCQETLAPRNVEHHATGRQQPEVISELG